MSIKNALRKILMFPLVVTSIFFSRCFFIFSTLLLLLIFFSFLTIAESQAVLKNNDLNNNYNNNYDGHNKSYYIANDTNALGSKFFFKRPPWNIEVYIEKKENNIASFLLQKNIEEKQCQSITSLLKSKYNVHALLPGQKITIKILKRANKNKKYYIDWLILDLSPAEALLFKRDGENFIVNEHYRKDIKKHVVKIHKINLTKEELTNFKKAENLLTKIKQGETNFFTRGRGASSDYYKYIAYNKDYRLPAYLIEEVENILQSAENNKKTDLKGKIPPLGSGKLFPRKNLELLLEVFSNNKGQIVGFGNILFISDLNNNNNKTNHINFSSSERIELYRYVDLADKISYIDPNNKENFFKDIAKPKFTWPIKKETPISSKFGPRKDPFLGKERFHKGVDFAAPSGTPIKAASSGKIIALGDNGGYGKYIKIQHNSNYETAYAHLSAYGKSLKIGSPVLQGQTIGYVGSSGRSTGAHLHYEVIFKNKHIDPLQVYSLGYEADANLEEIKAFNSQMAVIKKFRTAALYVIY